MFNHYSINDSNNTFYYLELKAGNKPIVSKAYSKVAFLINDKNEVTEMRDLRDREINELDFDRYLKQNGVTRSILKYIEYSEKELDDIKRIFEEESKQYEKKIIKDPVKAANWARYVIKGRWPEAEPYILKDPYAAVDYAGYVIKGRWPEAEPMILTHPYAATDYARYVIKGRWPEAEPYILTDLTFAVYYAQSVIKGRWPEAEPNILKDPYTARRYIEWLSSVNQR